LNIFEYDFRITALNMLCSSITKSIKEIKYLSDEAEKLGFNSSGKLESIEVFIGAAFVSCQEYAVGTVSDINRTRVNNGKNEISKIDCYKISPEIGTTPTKTELINATANYFKHNDEWESWPSSHTGNTLKSYNINQEISYPMIEALNILSLSTMDCPKLCNALSDWRKYLFMKESR
jgi:hypothetical protein